MLSVGQTIYLYWNDQQHLCICIWYICDWLFLVSWHVVHDAVFQKLNFVYLRVRLVRPVKQAQGNTCVLPRHCSHFWVCLHVSTLENNGFEDAKKRCMCMSPKPLIHLHSTPLHCLYVSTMWWAKLYDILMRIFAKVWGLRGSLYWRQNGRCISIQNSHTQCLTNSRLTKQDHLKMI